MILVDPPAEMDISAWPLVIDIDEAFYFKPDAGRVLASPANEDPMMPCDVQPEELDIAILIDRLQNATTMPIRRIAHQWAGLRSFVADHNLVIGMDPSAPGFFWLAGQGGYGITYLGRDTNLNKSVAIKEYLPRELAIRDGNNTVQPRNGQQGEFYKNGLRRFIKEAQTLARFKHPKRYVVVDELPRNTMGKVQKAELRTRPLPD